MIMSKHNNRILFVFLDVYTINSNNIPITINLFRTSDSCNFTFVRLSALSIKLTNAALYYAAWPIASMCQGKSAVAPLATVRRRGKRGR